MAFDRAALLRIGGFDVAAEASLRGMLSHPFRYLRSRQLQSQVGEHFT